MTHQAQDGEMLGKQKSRSQDPGRQEQARREASRCCLGWRKFIHCKINPRCLPNIKKKCHQIQEPGQYTVYSRINGLYRSIKLVLFQHINGSS